MLQLSTLQRDLTVLESESRHQRQAISALAFRATACREQAAAFTGEKESLSTEHRDRERDVSGWKAAQATLNDLVLREQTRADAVQVRAFLNGDTASELQTRGSISPSF